MKTTHYIYALLAIIGMSACDSSSLDYIPEEDTYFGEDTAGNENWDIDYDTEVQQRVSVSKTVTDYALNIEIWSEMPEILDAQNVPGSGCRLSVVNSCRTPGGIFFIFPAIGNGGKADFVDSFHVRTHVERFHDFVRPRDVPASLPVRISAAGLLRGKIFVAFCFVVIKENRTSGIAALNRVRERVFGACADAVPEIRVLVNADICRSRVGLSVYGFIDSADDILIRAQHCGFRF